MFYVRRKPTESNKIEKQSPIPDFDRTRTVTISSKTINNVDSTCLHCDCYYFIRHKHLCRHVYAVIGKEPSHLHVFPDCLKVYSLYMNKNSHFTQTCIDLTNLFVINQCLVLSEQIDSVCSNISDNSTKPVHWFLEAKLKTIDANQGFEFVEPDESESDEDITISALRRGPTQKKNHQDVYSHYYKDFKDVCNIIKHDNDDVKRIMHEGFTEMRMKLLELRTKDTVGEVSKGLNSFPSNTTVTKQKRKRPPGSPSR